MKEKLTRKSKPNFGYCLCDSCHYGFIVPISEFCEFNPQLYKNHCGKCEGGSKYVSKAFIMAKNKRHSRKKGGYRSKPDLAWWHYDRIRPLPF